MGYYCDLALAFGLLTYLNVAEVTSLAVMHVTPNANIINGDFVNVSWSGIEKTTKDDWLGYYCPTNDSDIHSISRFYPGDPNQRSADWSAGRGTWKLDVYNMRTQCEFRYFRLQNGKRHTVVRSKPLTFKNGDEAPLQGHIALTANPTEMRVKWTSSKVNHPMIEFGLSPKDLSGYATGNSTTYFASDMCNPPANTTGYWPVGMIHDVLLAGLQPNTKYYYRYGSRMGLRKVMTDIYDFTTAIPPGDKTPYKFVVYGDMGYTDQARKTIHQMVLQKQKNDIRYIIHYGDLSYAYGQAHLWDKWFHIIEPASVGIPYMVALGNHEQGYKYKSSGPKDPSGEGNPFWPFGRFAGFVDGSYGECGVPVYYKFHMPDTGNSVYWYSFDYGLVHQIVISTENDYRIGSKQYRWLKQDLKKVNRTKTPWVIIGGHRATYHSFDDAGDQKAGDLEIKHLEPLMHEYHVDLAFWAHNHNYERSCKVLKKVCRSDGITHIVVGTAGKSLDTAWDTKSYSVFRSSTYGHTLVTVRNETALLVEYVRSDDMKVIDHVWIRKNKDVPSPRGSAPLLTASVMTYLLVIVALYVL